MYFAEGTGHCMDNGNDCWYLYSLKAVDLKECENGLVQMVDEPDQTIEILMSDLDPKVMDNFRKDRFFNADEVTKVGLFAFH